MSIFDVDYINVVWQLLVPPDKRRPKWLAWGSAVMQGKQWWHNAVFTTYAGGSTDSLYNTSTTYHSGDRVIYSIQAGGTYYGDNAVYEALCINADGSINTAGFSGVPPTGIYVVPEIIPATITNSTQALAWLYGVSVNYPVWVLKNYIAGQIVLYTDGNAYQCIVNTTSGQNPSNNTYWQLYAKPGCMWVRVSNNFIGANERASYSAQKLIFEYALNKWFNTTFKQPVIGPSDIYITRSSNSINQFFFSDTDSPVTGYYFGPATNLTDLTIPPSSFFTQGNSLLLPDDFSINIPVADYNALNNETPVTAGNNTANRDAIVMSFANLLNPAGSFYNIITY